MPHAVVAGGSKGIGFAIATALAKRKYDLVLIARHEDALQKAKDELQRLYGISVTTLSRDLSKKESAEEVRAFCEQQKMYPTVLCNVAGIGGTDDYLTAPLEEMRYMIHLNIESMVALTQLMLPLMDRKNTCYILNVGSMAGLAPIPLKNLYSSTKSAVIFFSRALRAQLKNKNVRVSCLCPGPVFTKPEITKYTLEKLGKFGKLMAVPPARVGETAIKSLFNNIPIIIPGIVTKITAFFIKLLPERLLIFIYRTMVEKSR